MKYSITAITKVTFEHQPGMPTSQHVATHLRLEPSKNLDQKKYNKPNGLPTKDGTHAATIALIQGLVGNIHYAEQQGYRSSADHLRYIIKELERGFATPVTVGEATM